MTFKRAAMFIVVALAATFGYTPHAMADAAGPTDYWTDIVSIEPPTPSISVEMIGGDAFLSLAQLEPVEIVVLGYQGEPYLRYGTDGVVYENRRSPAVFLNQERYGNEEPPPSARADARPEWFTVADNGRYSWHDHRSHWMNPNPPPSAEPGDQVLEATVPITVDGQAVTITVASYLLDPPPSLPPTLGFVAAMFIIGIVLSRDVLSGQHRLRIGLVSLAAAASAFVLGLTAFRSVPSETQPSPLLWLLPALALASALVLMLIRNRTATTVYLDGLALAGGGLLLAWSISRLEALQRALIPSDAPAWLDRFAITAVGLLGLALAAKALLGLFRPQRLLTPEVSQ